MLTAQGENQHVVVRLLDMMGEEVKDLGLSLFSRESKLATPDAGRRLDAVVIGEVQTGGPGNVSRGTLNPRTVEPGALVIFNLFHRKHELMIQGQNVSTVNWEDVLGLLRVNDGDKTLELLPLQGNIICRVNEVRAQRIMMGQSKIIAPYGDAQHAGGTRYDAQGRPKEQIKVAVEDVVQQGPGAVVDGMWQEPNCRPGDAIMYDTSVSPVRFTVGGECFTVVHTRHVIMTFRDVSEELLNHKDAAYEQAAATH